MNVLGPRLQKDISLMTAILTTILPKTEDPAALIVTSGLPGAGKSHFSLHLARHLPLMILNSDALRKAIWVKPRYTRKENIRLYGAIHTMTKILLTTKTSVIIDSTNILETHRKAFYDIAKTLNIRFLLVHLDTPEEIIRLRLKQRQLQLDPSDQSEAGWEIYERMRSRVEPLQLEHLLIRSSSEFNLALNQIINWFTLSDSQLE